MWLSYILHARTDYLYSSDIQMRHCTRWLNKVWTLRRKVIPANDGRREEVSVLMSLYSTERQPSDVDLHVHI